jgi:hypothetical protein
MDQHQHWHDCVLALPNGFVIDLLYLKKLQQKDKPVPIVYCPVDAEFDMKKYIPAFIKKKDDAKNLYNLMDENGLVLFEHFPFENDDNDHQLSSFGVIKYIYLMKLQSITSVMLWQHQPSPKMKPTISLAVLKYLNLL